jgi:hypothetical protein
MSFALPTAGASIAAVRFVSPSTAKPSRAYRGDTLASALLANGVHLVGRSFKYHRPGAFCRRAEEPNALVTVSRDAARYTPNLRATQVELYRRSVRREPEPLAEPAASMSANQRSARRHFFPRGSTTRRSCGRARRGSRWYEPFIRRAQAWAARRRSPTRTAMRIAMRIAMSSSSAADPPALRQRGRQQKPARASCSAMSKRNSAAVLLSSSRCDDRRQSRLVWLRRPCSSRRPPDVSRCCRAVQPSAISLTTWSGLTSG